MLLKSMYLMILFIKEIKNTAQITPSKYPFTKDTSVEILTVASFMRDNSERDFGAGIWAIQTALEDHLNSSSHPTTI